MILKIRKGQVPWTWKVLFCVWSNLCLINENCLHYSHFIFFKMNSEILGFHDKNLTKYLARSIFQFCSRDLIFDNKPKYC